MSDGKGPLGKLWRLDELLEHNFTEEYHELINSIIDHAQTYWEHCPDDFCIQYAGNFPHSLVFGGTNRVTWDYKRGFVMDRACCTTKFLKMNEGR